MKNNFNKAIKKLDTLQKNASSINGENKVPFSELFSSQFMLQHTSNSFSSFSNFLNASKFGDVPFEEIPDDE